MLSIFPAVLLLLIGCAIPCHAQGCDSPYINAIGDGYCDATNNNPECLWDGGDCCPCTCVPGPGACTYFEPGCLDPDAWCACDDFGGQFSSVGDGYCDAFNNQAVCGYDGGDCCPCTCVPGPGACTYFDPGCIDPGAWCSSPVAGSDEESKEDKDDD